jgi:predicted SAM-dependent methyltransferase
MKLNIGCGFNKLDGYLNVDQFPECAPDVLWNLEQTPWPFEESSVDEMVAHHVLEHLGQETKVFFAVMQELYRLMRHDGLIRITVPHPNHPTFQSDPTHVRAFTYETFEMMNRAKNLDWAARNVNVTMLALMLDINFEIVSGAQKYDESWAKKIASGELTLDQVREAAETQLGVVYELIFTLRADKSHIGLVDATPPE